MKRLISIGLLCVLLVVGCSRTPKNAPLQGTIQFDDGFVIDVDDASLHRIARVLKEMDSGYGGTLVVDPKDWAIDSPAFVERYLKRFGDPTNLKDYDYQFERLLARVTQFPESLDDERLDSAIWSAYEKLETKHSGKTNYFHGGTNYVLDSARDLLWMYLHIHADHILSDENRRTRWMDRLLRPGAEVEKLARFFALLHLISSIQQNSTELTVWDVDSNTKIPGGQGGLDWFAEKTSAQWITWGFDPKHLPRPRIDNIYSGRWETSNAVDQESWSTERTLFKVSYFRPVGQRIPRYSIRVPTQLPADGIYLFLYEGQIHVWRKQEFYSGALRMAQLSGFLDEKEYFKYVEKLSLERLDITLRYDKK